MSGAAAFSDCGRYRYLLWRRWGGGAALVAVMLNPSRAGAERGDATLSLCLGRARRAGFGALTVVNLFALIDPCPGALRRAADPVGPANDAAIGHALVRGGAILCAWGNDGARGGRAEAVAARLRAAGRPLLHLGLTQTGQPRHPRGVPLAREMVRWE